VVTLKCGDSTTLPALSVTPFIELQIVSAVGMTLGAMSLAGGLSRRSGSAQDVDLMGYRFKVVRVDAATVTASVVEDQTFGDGADVKFVGVAVGEFQPTVYIKLSVVGAASLGTNPFPAIVTGADLLPEALFDRFGLGEVWVAVPTGANIVQVAHSLRQPR